MGVATRVAAEFAEILNEIYDEADQVRRDAYRHFADDNGKTLPRRRHRPGGGGAAGQDAPR